MARYVVVEFAENEDAEEFIQQTNELNAGFRKDGLSFQRRIVGVFVKPGRTCDCGDWVTANSGVKNGLAEIVRGEKFGWWVCTRCKKPRRGGHQLVNQILPSETYEGPAFHEYEMTVCGLQVSGYHKSQIKRRKKLRKKKVK